MEKRQTKRKVAGKKLSPITDLETHPRAFVTVAELAEYWAVSRQQIYGQISTGTLSAINIGNHLFRIKTADAIKFEQRGKTSLLPEPKIQRGPREVPPPAA